MIELIRAAERDAQTLWEMQKEAFAAMLETYRDYDTSPANEPLEKVLMRLQSPNTYIYYIVSDGETVGAIRVIDRKDGSRKKISPLFIAPAHRNRGYAQRAMEEAERIHGRDHWALDTILQEAGNCHLYEKMGYRRTGKQTPINERMTLVFYEKDAK
ncbi:MAG: GNAT family N-acetyltransferase [Clostridia bacterium]|nr:GNAT family N-acetyltransferase [Clostridia bacterium]